MWILALTVLGLTHFSKGAKIKLTHSIYMLMALDGGVEFSLLTNMPYFLDLTRSLQQEYFLKNERCI